MADAIILIIKFDSIFQSSAFQHVWPQYMNAIKSTEKNIKVFNEIFTISDIIGLKNILSKIEHLVSGYLFKVSDQDYVKNAGENYFQHLFVLIFYHMEESN